jgi:tight adherence protein C
MIVMTQIEPLLIPLLAFGCVVIIVLVAGRYAAYHVSMQRRLATTSALENGGSSRNVAENFFLASLASKIDERKFGIEGVLRSKLRRDLIRAGYFSENAIKTYILVRIVLVLTLPVIIFLLTQIFLAELRLYITLGLVALSAVIAILGPDAYIARRQKKLQYEYRTVFPDVIDMLVVCVDAGLSMDGAIARIQPEVSKQSDALGMNLALLGAETRAGRSTADALGNFAERLNIDEARAFVIMVRQSLELGTDVADALRVFSDEMRGKRLLRAEENANKLPVKMVIPLGGFIFPVILMVVLVPVIIKLLSVANVVGGGR